MNEYFKNKKSDLIVQYLGTITYYNIDEWECHAGGIEDRIICAKCIDTKTGELMAIPLLILLNYFESYDKPITDMISEFYNTPNAENEGNKKNIHPLYSRESETNEERPTKGVQE